MLAAWKKLCSNSWTSRPGRAERGCCGCFRPCHPTSPFDWTVNTCRSLQSPNCWITFVKMIQNKSLLPVWTKLKLPSEFETKTQTILGVNFSFTASRSKRKTWLYRIPNTVSKVLSGTTEDCLYCRNAWLTHRFRMKLGKPLGLSKEWFSESEGFDS